MVGLEAVLHGFEGRIDMIERASVAAAPVRFSPASNEINAFVSNELQEQRRRGHDCLPVLRFQLSEAGHDISRDPELFGMCMKLAFFELRHRFVLGWPGFVLVFVKLLGAENAAWFPALFLGAVATPNMPRVAFELDEVLSFGQALEELAS